MSKAASSPTSRLLRSSRLFSLPHPLPSAQLDRPSAHGQYKGSDTATLPYPTHQAIATPASSNYRGDWGLKRPLPAKSTRRTSTPVIRVYQHDTYEHITDFSSAADHVLNARKWAEMGVPMIHHRANSQQPKVSAYEDAMDNTVTGPREVESNAVQAAPTLLPGRRLKPQRGQRPALPNGQRWKYSGPWIAGMQEQEFSMWLKQTMAEIQGSTAWFDFVCQRYEDRRLLVAQRRARDEGEPMDADEVQRLRKLLRPSHEECQSILKQLRDAHETQKLHSELTGLICDFLDLPGVKRKGTSNGQTDFASSVFSTLGTGVDSRGPPSTHPGGGLSYVRTNAYMENHPLYGPQTHRSPVLARVLRTRVSTSKFAQRQAQLGVGGFVTIDPVSATLGSDRARNNNEPLNADTLAHELNPDLEGGNKIWVHPDTATMEANGSIDLKVVRANDEAVAVKTGDVQSILESKAAVFAHNRPARLTPSLRRDRTEQGGFGFSATRPGSRLPGVSGFDEDGRVGPVAAGGEQRALGQLKGLFRESQEEQQQK